MDPPPPLSLPPSSIASFPILATSIIGILSTSILLLSYYVFVIKCSLNSHHPEFVPRLSRPRGRPAVPSTAPAEHLGLGESAIRAIPTFRYRARTADAGSSHECAVCLNEFQEEERIKLLPDCLHLFHIDCIDTWLQCNANCPLCRSSIAASIPHRHFPALDPRRDDARQAFDVMIEVTDAGSDLVQAAGASASAAASPWKTEQGMGRRKTRHFAGSRGDECIADRTRDEQFCVKQPMRRSFSMDSSGDWELYVALQKILQQNSHLQQVSGESSSSSSRLRRSFFSFGRTRSSRSSVLPVQI